MKKEKKGAIIQGKIIGIIILIIVAAIIIAFVVTELAIGRTAVNKQDCYNTVVARNNAFVRGEFVQTELVPLRCKTEEIAIKTTNEEEIKKTIANAMYDCWWMLGEGKMNFLKDDAYIRLMPKDSYAEKVACLLCSTITFDEKVKDKNLQLDVLSYMETTKIPIKNMTYLDFLTNSENSELDTSQATTTDRKNVNTGQDYAVIYLSAKGGKLGNEIVRNMVPAAVWSLIGTAGTAIVGIILSATGVGTIPGIALVGVAVASFVTLTATGTAMSFTEKVNIANAYCDKEMNGCNLVMLVPQNEESFATCTRFSNIP
jgi:hypothetical protein